MIGIPHRATRLFKRKPKDCLIRNGGECQKGGSCDEFCGTNGFCCSKNGNDLNGNCPQGNFSIKIHFHKFPRLGIQAKNQSKYS